jgi:hypothetical protein
MKFSFLKRKKFWWWFLSITLALPVVLFGVLLLIVYFNQDAIVQNEIDKMNRHHKGMILVGDTHLAPFEDFPYISIKVDNVKILESKDDDAPVILDVEDIYLGFNLWDIVMGDYDIQSIIVENGFFNIVIHPDGTSNLENALATSEEASDDEAPNIHLQNIELRELDIHHYNETTKTDVEAYVHSAIGGFKTINGEINTHVDTKFDLNVFMDGDTTYIHDKEFEIHADLEISEESGMIIFKPSEVKMEHGDFQLEGFIDTKNDMTVDLSVGGTKPNFDMLISFAPHDLVPILERYKNAGDIYLNGFIQGPTKNGQMPYINVDFGAKEAFLENTVAHKRIDDMRFEGHFTNGPEKSMKTMEFSLKGIHAKLESGTFTGSVLVKNFEEPDINMEVDADFDLEFLTEFFALDDIEDVKGQIELHMKFHDIIDLDDPAKALEDLNQSYYSELKVNGLSFKSNNLPKPLKSLDLHLTMDGKKADMDKCDILLGESDLSITGYLSDLPAVIHHTDIPVIAHLEIKSNLLDISELTKYSAKTGKGINEQIEDLSAGFSFKTSAQKFTESKYLPRGEFFIDSLHAQLKHYPHELHDFHVDLIIDDDDLSIVDFTGYIDHSDFHFNGFVHDYEFWMQDSLEGDVDLDITLKSDQFHLEDIFSYKGENYVPVDYRHEEFDKLQIHANTSMHFRSNKLHSIDIELDRFTTKMKIHPMRFENFHGRIHYEDDHIMINKLHGKIGRTVFDTDLNYYIGNNPKIRKRDNYFRLKANFIDFDQLFSFNTSNPNQKEQKVVKTTADAKEHAEAFNIYDLPFTDMKIDLDVGHFMYHRIDLQKIHARLRTTYDHYLYVDTLSLNAAGGNLKMSGYFNGSDPKHIYLKPNIVAKRMNLDKLMFKFENFGQDEVLSDNIHGNLNAKINGKIRVYPDMVPDLDQSEIHIDVEVLKGRLENYAPIMMLSDYIGNKNLQNIRFDTLKNHMDIKNGAINIPKMDIETTLGHFEFSGKQDNKSRFEYYIRIPWKLINQSVKYKLFGKKDKESLQKQEDKIVKKDPKGRGRYLNLKLTGTTEDFKIRLGKDRKK